jgi:hypothetical protein
VEAEDAKVAEVEGSTKDSKPQAEASLPINNDDEVSLHAGVPSVAP